MKRYKDYMDGVEASDTLHEKLKNLEEPKKKPQPWVKYGAAAAALALVAGVGAYGLSRGGWDAADAGWGWDLPAIGTVDVGQEDIPAPEIADIPAPDIAIVGPMSPPNDPDAPADRTNGGYEIVDGEMAVYYGLPYLEWVDASALPQASLDYSLAPPGSVDRELTWDDVLLFTGGEKAMADHLLWDGLDWSGTIWFLEDGTPCGAFLRAEGNDMSFTLELMLDYHVPSCVVLPVEYYETSRWQGTKITTVKNGGGFMVADGVWMRASREVKFFSNGIGYKLTLSDDDAARADELCARFVRYAVDGGLHLYALSDEPIYEEDMPNEDGGPGYIEPIPALPDAAPIDMNGDDIPDEDSESFSCPYCADGTVHTHPYDPSTRD